MEDVLGGKVQAVAGGAAPHPRAALVLDGEPDAREFMRFALAKRCGYVEVVDSIGKAEQLLERCRFDLLVVNGDQTRGASREWLSALRGGGSLPTVLLTANPERAGGLRNTEVVRKPVVLEQMLAAVERALDDRDEADATAPAELPDGCGVCGVVSHSAAMSSLLEMIERVATRNTTVLLEGESGTGKEVVARCLHRFSGRAGPFAPVNCGAISAELLESELFGHIRGAFTGATQARQGLVSYADGGTLFLDEIGELPLAMQAKLLRVLEERTIRPVGQEQEQPVDLRVVAATNRNLEDEVRQGNFREDLYYRLNVVSLRLPPLRERPTDIPKLAALFARRLARELAVPPLRLTDVELQPLLDYAWPGNVRELKNVIERSLLFGISPAEAFQRWSYEAPVSLGSSQCEQGYSLALSLAEVEKRHIGRVLEAVGGNKSAAARRLGVARKTLERKLKAWESPA